MGTKLLLSVTLAMGLVVIAVIPATMMASVLAGESSPGSAVSMRPPTTCSLGASDGTFEDLDEEQLANARTLIAVGKSLGVPPRGWVIAIATALQESGLRNLEYGDRDSRGLMQQRPSMGWGTPDQVTDPVYAARAFYGGPKSPTQTTGLLSVPGWERMPVWEAAQTVQRSAFPFAYAKHEALAVTTIERLDGRTAGCDGLGGGPWQLPLQRSYALTSSFGPRISPTKGTLDFHTGQDFAAQEGTPVVSASRGEVVFAGWNGGYGNLVRVRHSRGVESWYAHLSEVDVEEGERVHLRQRLGAIGSTGNSTGPHLHLEIRVNDQPVDPAPWLSERGLRL